jgi:hypothetical protein
MYARSVTVVPWSPMNRNVANPVLPAAGHWSEARLGIRQRDHAVHQSLAREAVDEVTATGRLARAERHAVLRLDGAQTAREFDPIRLRQVVSL